jgi:hypothetical protein
MRTLKRLGMVGALAVGLGAAAGVASADDRDWHHGYDRPYHYDRGYHNGWGRGWGPPRYEYRSYNYYYGAPRYRWHEDYPRYRYRDDDYYHHHYRGCCHAGYVFGDGAALGVLLGYTLLYGDD